MTVPNFVAKANVQAFLAVSMVLLVAYGFVTGKLSGEAILPIAGGVILYFFPGQKPEK